MSNRFHSSTVEFRYKAKSGDGDITGCTHWHVKSSTKSVNRHEVILYKPSKKNMYTRSNSPVLRCDVGKSRRGQGTKNEVKSSIQDFADALWSFVSTKFGSGSFDAQATIHIPKHIEREMLQYDEIVFFEDDSSSYWGAQAPLR